MYDDGSPVTYTCIFQKMSSAKKKQFSGVIAIDFGTSYSGYACWSGGSDIYLNEQWYSGEHRLTSLKTPTCILLNGKKKFQAFGYEAENVYSKLKKKEQQSSYYFHSFKMKLYDSEVKYK